MSLATILDPSRLLTEPPIYLDDDDYMVVSTATLYARKALAVHKGCHSGWDDVWIKANVELQRRTKMAICTGGVR